jgi:signal transduction histidine kinase
MRGITPRFLASVVVVAAAAAVVDVSLPAGLAGGIPYLALVLLGWYAADARQIYGLSILATLLSGTVFLASAEGAAVQAEAANGLLVLMAIWAVALVLAAAKRRERELRESREALDARLREQDRRLSESQTHAEITNHSASEFLANMGHELRTPLNAIIGFSEVVKNELFGPIGSAKYRDYMNDINDSGQHLLDLINDLMDMAKIEAGRVELMEDAVNVPGLLRDCVEAVRPAANAGGVRLETRIAEGMPALRADTGKLRQVLDNLLGNAVRFTPPGGTVTLAAWSRSNTGYVFQVTDTGIGIALKDIPIALAPFGQIPNDLCKTYEGTGLGLPLSKALVEMHAGSIDLQSEPGAGTTVTVRLPAERGLPVQQVA